MSVESKNQYMMRLSLPLLCISVSLEGIVCPLLLDFVVDNFRTADIYTNVAAEGDSRTGRLIFRKGMLDAADSDGLHVVEIREILRHTLKQEGNCPKIVSFSISGASADYNIKFRTEKQARLFVRSKALPLVPYFFIRWARIYSHSGPVIITYEKFDTGEMGIKLLDNEDYSNEYERLSEQPYIFMRSDIKNEMRTTPPHTLFLRNKTYWKDYMIEFRSTENLATFLELFPDRIHEQHKTRGYYIVPFAQEPHETSE